MENKKVKISVDGFSSGVQTKKLDMVLVMIGCSWFKEKLHVLFAYHGIAITAHITQNYILTHPARYFI
jgi:uncharacterized Fe-S cluster-containing MiaB family protein